MSLRQTKEPGNQGESPAERPGQRAVQSIEVGGRLLLALSAQAVPMSLKDLAASADLSPSRAHPYLVSFVRLGLIEQDSVSGRYALGPAAFQIGLACLHQAEPIRVANRVAQALVERSGQSVAIAVWANFGPTIVRLIDGSHPMHVNMRAGTVMEMFGTATGRAFAAVLPTQRIERALAAPYGGVAPAGRITGRELEAVLAPIVADFEYRGIARAVGNPIPGINAFSAVVRDHEGTPALVLTALGAADRFPTDWDSPIARALREAADEASSRLGHRPRS